MNTRLEGGGGGGSSSSIQPPSQAAEQAANYCFNSLVDEGNSVACFTKVGGGGGKNGGDRGEWGRRRVMGETGRGE